ncbi:MAG TPA: hypothetical protein VFM91_09135 [Propionibacteriaceae bacterium]|nr:hypothetical protein [Propionibacteriaceae bacterium]
MTDLQRVFAAGWVIAIAGNPRVWRRFLANFAWPLSLARRVREQRQRQRGPKIYSLHAREVECIGKGKPHKPWLASSEVVEIRSDAWCGVVV